jgi:hypothetical protein
VSNLIAAAAFFIRDRVALTTDPVGSRAKRSTLAGKIVARSVDVLDRINFAPAALRVDLAGERTSARRLHSAAEMLNHASDLYSDSAGLDNDNERRWRVFRVRVLELLTPGRQSSKAQ